MIDLHIQAEYDYNLREVEMKQVSGLQNRRILPISFPHRCEW